MLTVFDQTQRLHEPPQFIVAGTPQPSPERAERIDMLLEGVERIGSKVVVPPPISREALETVHHARYLDFMETLRERWGRVPGASDIPLPNVYALGRATLPEAGYPEAVVGQAGFHLGDGACPVMDKTWQSAKASAACAAHAASLLLGGEKIVYSLCRPPGHHAAADMAAGFCYINNSALAAELLTRAGRKVAILDIDVHHGNGTEAIFYDRADVLTVSIHAHPKRFYPFFWGYQEERGRDKGDGFNLNLPLERGTTIEPYCRALDQGLECITSFGADTLVVAAGLDIAVDDPFKGFAIETPEFTRIGKIIAGLGKPMVIVQEGGYPSPSLSRNLSALLEGFLQ
ncbi:MAG: histone deacetylase family protein [Aestuariivirga sp.]